MTIPGVLAVVAVFGLLRLRRAKLLLWAGAWWVGTYVVFRFGFTAPIPASVISIYMGIVSIAILAYVSSSQERREEVSGPLLRLMTDKRYTALLVVTAIVIPALAAANVYVRMNVPLEPPFFARTVHPAPPAAITVHEAEIDLDAGDNPFRHLETENPEAGTDEPKSGTGKPFGLLVFFVLITQAGDVLQYGWGKLVGRRIIAPQINANRSWEGLIGGVCSTSLLGSLLWLVTPFPIWEAALMSMIVAIMGFAGGMTMSAIKRDRGVQDYGTLVRGHLGVLDRIDSLCFAAPVFYHLTYLFFSVHGS